MPHHQDFFQVLCKLSGAFALAQSRDELLNLVFEAAVSTLEAKAACLYLVDRERLELLPVGQRGLSNRYFRSRRSLLIKQIIPMVVEEGFLFVRDAATDPRLENREAKQEEGIASILALPVMAKMRNIGVFCVFTGLPHDFTVEELEFLTVLAQQLGGVMEHARLLERMRRQIRLFYEAAARLAAGRDSGTLLSRMLGELTTALGVRGASLHGLSQDGALLEPLVNFGMSEEYLIRMSRTPDKSLSRALKGTTTVVKNTSVEKVVSKRQENLEERIAAILTVPVKKVNKVLGVIRLYSATPRDFSEPEIGLATAVAHLASLALQQSGQEI